MTIIFHEHFSNYGVYELRLAVNRLRDLIAAVDGEAADGWSVADSCDNGAGGDLSGHEIEVIDASYCLSSQVFLIEEAIPEIAELLDRLVRDGYEDISPEDDDEYRAPFCERR